MIRAAFAWLIGHGNCPACDRELVEHEAGYHVCRCGVVVDYANGGWSYAGESTPRRLPGVAGMPWDRRNAA